MKYFAKMKRLLAILLCISMCMSMCVPALAVDGTSIELVLSSDSLEATGNKQTVTLDITTTEPVSVDSLMYTVEVPTGFTITQPTMPAGITGVTWSSNQLIWYSLSTDVTGLTNLGSIAVTVPADVTPGSYEMKVTGFDASANATYWVEQADYSITLTIKEAEVPATGISLSSSSLTLEEGKTAALTATVDPSNSTDAVVWSSSDDTVAAVDETGNVTAYAVGSAIITAKAGDVSATCTVTVVCAHTNKTSIDAKDSTCKAQGWDAYSECTCGQLFDVHGNKISDIPYRPLSSTHTGGTATCKAQAVCTVCEQPYGELGEHTYGELIPQKDPGHSSTSLAEGMKAHYICSVCEEYFDADKNQTTAGALILPAPVHTYNKEVPTETYLKTPANCTDSAVYYKSCECGAKGTATFSYGEADGHTMVATPAKNPTCTEKGNSAYWTCSVCSNVYADENGDVETSAEEYTIKEKGHAPASEWAIDEINGTHYHKCLNGCSERFDEKEHEAAEGAAPAANGTQHWYVCEACSTEFDHANHDAAGNFYPDGDQHYQKCSICSHKVDSTLSNHVTDLKHNENQHWDECTACGQQSNRVNHSAENADAWESDANGHWQLCKCTEKVNADVHDSTILTDNGNGTHNESCSVCEYVVNENVICTPIDGDYNESQHWGVCACGATVDATSHTLEYSDNGDNSHKVFCDCGYVATASEAHNTTGVTDYGADSASHWKVCTDCGASANVTPHSAKDSNWNHDENGHWQLCVCGEKVNSTSHSAWSYTPAEYDQHTVKCGTCEYSYIEDCDTTGAEWSYDENKHWKACALCNDKTGENVHVPASEWSKNTSNHWHDCECGYEADKTGHTFDQTTKEFPVNNDTDCQTPAQYYKSCVCGEKGTDTWESDKGNHKLELVAAVDPSCTEDGNIAYYRCTVDGCGKYFSDEEGSTEIELSVTVDPKTGHKMTETPAAEPSCMDKGTLGYFTCSNSCGKVYEDIDGTKETNVTAREIPEWGHKFDDESLHGPTTLKTSATCKTPAEFWYTCSNENCDVVSTEHFYPFGGPAPHSTSNTRKTEAKAETCTEDGIVAHWDCIHCGTIFADDNGALGEEITEADTVIKAHGHTQASEWSYDDDNHWYACACEKGCENGCGAMIEDTKAAHEWVKQDTSTAEREDYLCSVCEHTMSKDVVKAPVEDEKDDDYSIVVKVKFDGVDEDEIDEVNAILVRNGKAYKNKDITEKKDWKHEWTGLDDSKKWSVDAKEIAGYNVDVDNVRGNYWVITISKEAEKVNPETGASEFVGAVVALAACSAVCGAALMLKRK